MPNLNVVRTRSEDGQEPGSSSTTAVGFAAQAAPSRQQYNRFRSEYDAPQDRKWQVEVVRQMMGFLPMQSGWDSYDAPPIGRDVCFFALEVLHSVMHSRTPIPQVVPSSVGGIQLEWHVKGIDLELHITAPYQCEVWFRDRLGGEPISEEISNDFSFLERPISELTSRR